MAFDPYVVSMHWFSLHTRRIAHLLLLSLALSVSASCDMVVSIGVLGDLLGMTAAHADHDAEDHCTRPHDAATHAPTSTDASTNTNASTTADASCSDEASCTAESDEAGGCCAPGSDDCALPCWYCGCAHTFSFAVEASNSAVIPLLLQGAIAESVAATLATDRPRLIHPPSIA